MQVEDVGCDAYSHLEVDKASSIGIFSTTCCTDFQPLHKMPITVSYYVVARIDYWVKLASTVDGYGYIYGHRGYGQCCQFRWVRYVQLLQIATPIPWKLSKLKRPLKKKKHPHHWYERNVNFPSTWVQSSVTSWSWITSSSSPRVTRCESRRVSLLPEKQTLSIFWFTPKKSQVSVILGWNQKTTCNNSLDSSCWKTGPANIQLLQI